MAGATKAHVIIMGNLSDSTEAFDRGDKFSDYKSIPELEEYVLVHQNQVLVEQFQHKSDTLWLPQIFRAGEQMVFESVGFTCEIMFIDTVNSVSLALSMDLDEAYSVSPKL